MLIYLSLFLWPSHFPCCNWSQGIMVHFYGTKQAGKMTCTKKERKQSKAKQESKKARKTKRLTTTIIMLLKHRAHKTTLSPKNMYMYHEPMQCTVVRSLEASSFFFFSSSFAKLGRAHDQSINQSINRSIIILPNPPSFGSTTSVTPPRPNYY